MTSTPGAGEPYPVVDLSEPETWQDLHRILGAAREQSPVSRSLGSPALTVLRYDDVEAVLRDPRVRSVEVELIEQQGVADGPLHRWWQKILFATNPPRHTRLRGLLGRAFTPRSVTTMKERIREISHELIDEAAGRGEMEFIDAFAHHLPVRVIAEMLAIPPGDYRRFARWSSDLGLAFTGYITPEIRELTEAAVSGLYEYVTELVEERRRRPGPDLVSGLIAAEEQGDRLSHEELLAMVVNLLFAGHDTTKSLLGAAVLSLLRHPAELARLRADPSLMEGAVEEILRFEGPIFGLLRLALEPLEVGGVRFEPGDQLALSLLAANRDPRRFPDPDRFDITRRDTRHFAFGYGLHYCIGASLAKLEVQEALGILLERCPGLELATDSVRWVPYASIRRLESLPVRL